MQATEIHSIIGVCVRIMTLYTESQLLYSQHYALAYKHLYLAR